MTETLKSQLFLVKKSFDELIASTTEERKDLSDKIALLTKFVSRYEDSWAGDWVDNPNLFYKNFNPSNQDGMNADESYIKKDLLKMSGVDLNTIPKRITSLSKMFFELKDFILSELSFIKDVEAYKNEIELLNQIEEFKWGINPSDYIRSRRPQLAFVQNPFELNKGLATPSIFR